MGEGSGKTKVAFVFYPGLTVLDLVGPLDVFVGATRFVSSIEPVVVGSVLDPMPTNAPIRLAPSHTFEDVPDPDVVIVPGGNSPTIRAMGDASIRAYLLSVAGSADVVASVCTGALILGAAGLLEGRRATTHWAYHRLLERLGATYVPDRWVVDGRFMTSAGVSAGIDLALALLARLTDEDTTRKVQLSIEYDPKPPFGPIDWDGLDRDVFMPVVEQMVATELADHPDLQARLMPRA